MLILWRRATQWSMYGKHCDGGQGNDYNNRYSGYRDDRRHLSVLAWPSLTSGRSYFEVQVKGNTQWNLGVTTIPSISDQITFIPSHGYWILTYNKDGLVFSDDPDVRVPLRAELQKVGVFVDYDKGQFSFYEVEARVQIYSATGCTFKKPLFPILGLGSIYDDVSSACLIISPVNQTN